MVGLTDDCTFDGPQLRPVNQQTNLALHGADQAAAADQLLDAIGMIRLVRVEKSRTIYRHADYDAVAVSIDSVRGAGVFVETEVMTTDKSAAAGLLERIEQQLGLAEHPVVDLPYRDLVMQAVPVD